MLRVGGIGALPAPSSVPSEVAQPSHLHPTALHTQLSIFQAPHSLHSSRRAVVIQRPRAPTTRVGQVNGITLTRLPHLRRATTYCAVVSWHPEAAPMSLAGLRILAQTRPEAPKFPVNSPNVHRSRFGGVRFALAYVLDRIASVSFPAQASRGIRGPTAVSRPRTRGISGMSGGPP